MSTEKIVPATPELDAFSIDEFARRHAISRAHVYELFRRGEGPRTMRLGRRVLISREAAAEWRRRMEELAAERGE